MAKTAAELARTHDFKWSQKAQMSSLSHAAPLTPPPAAAVSNNDVADAPEPESPPVATRAAPAGKARRVFTKAAEVVPEKNEINLGGGVEGSGLGDFGDTEAVRTRNPEHGTRDPKTENRKPKPNEHRRRCTPPPRNPKHEIRNPHRSPGSRVQGSGPNTHP
ncbi:hypothetical protein T484DRAFT_1741223 [Baffinella frigidus]|nr:hypothetical protein T484DRAFT_1741223 [Cryptophyta sp. CCMP2293]